MALLVVVIEHQVPRLRRKIRCANFLLRSG